MMLGYLNRDVDEVFDEEGFFHMGDIGYYDSSGRMYFCDRMKDLIKYELHHVYPAEVEEVGRTNNTPTYTNACKIN